MSSDSKIQPWGRIAVVQACWALQVHTLNFVTLLAKNGFAVDVYLVDASSPFASPNTLKDLANVRVFQFDSGKPHSVDSKSLISRIYKRASRYLHLLLDPIDRIKLRFDGRSLSMLLDPNLESQFQQEFCRHRKAYHFVVGIESVGLLLLHKHAWFSSLMIYYSLELYLTFHPLYPQSRRLRHLKRLESMAHGSCAATIVQDPIRARCLLDSNKARTDLILLPVSLPVENSNDSAASVRKIFAIPNARKVILYFGSMRETRFVAAIIEQSQKFPSDWTTVLHSGDQVTEDYISQLRKLDRGGSVIFSLRNIEPTSINGFIQGADVGLVFYNRNTLNELHTGYASEKAARYSAVGVPFVAFDVPTFNSVMQQYNCGLTISALEELPTAIEHILLNHAAFRHGALMAFESVYCLNAHEKSVVTWFKNALATRLQ
jgi:glycosyltransferase involved in cell wall biosynthesis